MSINRRSALIASIILASACPAFRASALTMTTWTFSGVTFNDGGTLTGYAEYFSNGTWAWDITTTSNNQFGFHFTVNNEFESTNFNGIGQPNFEFVATDYSHQLWFYTYAPGSPNSGDAQPAFFQPDAGATYRLFNTGFAQSLEIGLNGGSRYLVSGTVTGVTVNDNPSGIPNIDTAQSFYGSSTLAAGNVNPQFDGGTLRLEAPGFIDHNFTTSALSGTIDLYGNNLILTSDLVTGVGGLTIADSLHSNAAPGGTLTLAEIFLYQGPTKINSGAVVSLGASGAISGNLPATPLILNGTFLLNGNTQTLASLSGTDPTATLDMGPNFGALTISGAASTTYAGKIIGSGFGGLTLSGPTNLTLTGNNSYSGSTTISAGATLHFSGASSSTLSFIFGPGSLIVDSGASLSSSFVQQLSTWTLNGIQTIRPNNNTNSSLVSISATAPLIAHSGSAYTGKLDLNNNPLLIQTSDSSSKAIQLSALSAAITAGSSGGTWTGNGITSSTAAADPQHLALGLFDNASLGKTNVGGQLVNANSLIVVLVHRGDLNGDGTVDIQDLTIVANNWQKPATNWASGDLNGDGVVDIQDLTIVANNWQQTSPYLIPGPGFAITPAASPVPEPATLLLFSPILLTLKRRRSRR